MSTIRIAVASTPLTATLDAAVPAAVAAVEEAGRLGARIICLPETGLPGHRVQGRIVPDVSQGAPPDGRLVTSLAYGVVGVVAADVDLDLADRRLALRWAPERNERTAGRL